MQVLESGDRSSWLKDYLYTTILTFMCAQTWIAFVLDLKVKSFRTIEKDFFIHWKSQSI